MSGNSFGKVFKVTTFGESHGECVGVVVDGCPAGIDFDIIKIQEFVDKRKPGMINQLTSTKRREEDIVLPMSGVFQGKTTGTPIMMMVKNKDHKSSAYNDIKNVFRPGHGDFTYFSKYGIRDWRGGGRSSARETVARVAAGGLALLLLERENISVSSWTKELGGIKAVEFNKEDINSNSFLMPDNKAAQKVAEMVDRVRKEGDSLGGIVEINVKSVPPGLGEPVFDKLDADLAKALMGIGAVKGVEIGRGFEAASLKGSQNNDLLDEKGFKSNNSGGILAGISNGDDLIIKIAVKPIPSISIEQETMDENGEKRIIKIKGRHDISAIPRINAVAEAMVAIVMVDHLLRSRANR